MSGTSLAHVSFRAFGLLGFGLAHRRSLLVAKTPSRLAVRLQLGSWISVLKATSVFASS